MSLRSVFSLLSLLLGVLGVAIPASAADPARVSVLVYHRFGPTVPGPTTVRTSVFAEQLAWLMAHHIPIVPLHALVDGLKRGELPQHGPVVALTADDGHRSVYTDMFPLIRRYRVPVTLFIYPSAISNADYALTWQQLAEMVASGLVDVESHTYWHPDFRIEARRLSPAAYEAFVRRQLTLSKERLETRLGIKVDLLAWPFGVYDAFLERLAAEAGYVAAFSIEQRPVSVGDNLFALPRYIVSDSISGSRFAALVMGPALGDPPP
jgi:peptidoglycan/xylan/chitin deacetylase (PgdA/CDA1 family)